MPVFRLSPDPIFPPPVLAEENGLLAVGGDLSPERLIAGYQEGIFPWYSDGDPILWWSPDPRLVLLPNRLHISRSLKKTLRQKKFKITFNQAFPQVMRACAKVRETSGTWITEEMMAAYTRLHKLGHAHSVEAWRAVEEEPEEGGSEKNNSAEKRLELVGGVYGVALGGTFFGESMFYLQRDASKVAFVSLVQRLQEMGYALIDCQMTTPHLLSLGAEEIPRSHFLQILYQTLGQPTTPWG
ncbi:MAG: leucyl/phenylalanyl-tRNA--protein transferase [Magnetococcales bacterium]|nr:leucyl/phenylalanyl-tRNA--protein transferase [Magnetococcales bacterium]